MSVPEPPQRRLLVIEDDADVSFTICTIAASAGFETRSAASWEGFLAERDGWRPTHIVVDLAMPDVDGVETMQQLAKSGSDAVVIVTSGLGAKILSSAATAAAENGVRIAGVLPKPFTPARLRALLNADPPARGDGVAQDPASRSRVAFDITAEMLSTALESGALRVHYQPKVSCAKGTLVGFEALVRWEHPEFGTILPDRFIPVAERSGLISRLTRQVIEQALSWMSRSLQDPDIKISLNLSASSLDDRELARWISRRCSELSIQPGRVTIEMTETTAVKDPVEMLEILTKFRITGFDLSIDDFGVGYSSLIQLVRLPFSEIKIDKVFVGSAGESDESRKIVSAVVSLGRALGLYVTAEGVEDARTLEYLRQIGCDAAQGYLIARPMDAAAALEWVRSRGSHRHDTQGAVR